MGACQSKSEEIIREKDKRISELVSDLDATTQEKKDVQEERRQLEQRLEEELAKIKSLEDEGKQKDTEIGELKETTQKLEGDLETTKQEKDAEINELKESAEKRQVEFTELRKEKDAEIQSLNSSNEKLDAELRDSEQKQDQLSLELAQAHASLEQTKKDLAAAKSKGTGWGFGRKKEEQQQLAVEPAKKTKRSKSLLGRLGAGKTAKDDGQKLSPHKESDELSVSKSKSQLGAPPADASSRKDSHSKTDAADSDYSSSSGYEQESKNQTQASPSNDESSASPDAGEVDAKLYTSKFLKGKTLLRCGLLAKKNPGGLVGMHLWKDRYCVLTPDAFHYFGKPSDSKPKGSIELPKVRTVAHQPQDARKFAIALTNDERIYEWRAENDEVVDKWIAAIEEARVS